jgi:hypothetical protein
MVQGAARAKRHEDHVALGAFGRLADGFRHFACLAMTEADAALLVADNDEGCKTETAAALDHLGNAVDVYELVDELAVALFALPRLSRRHFFVPCPVPYSFPESTAGSD